MLGVMIEERDQRNDQTLYPITDNRGLQVDRFSQLDWALHICHPTLLKLSPLENSPRTKQTL